MAGRLLPGPVRRAEFALVASVCLSAGAAAAPGGVHRFDIPAGALGSAILRFGNQADVSIGITDPSLAARTTDGVYGALSIEAGLAALLGKCGCRAERDAGGVYRIIASPPQLVVAALLPKPPPPPPPPQDIIVTATKLRRSLADYPGAVDIVDLESADRPDARRYRGSGAIVANLPSFASTALGPGRNKLFIRGLADSSFTGPTQATVGEYLGDVRLTYAAPDPDLYLYDVARVEVLEGPKGTLYGTGTLGGIIRIVPEAPVDGEVLGSVASGVSSTAHGGFGGDLAAMLNLPLVGDKLTGRGIAYVSTAPGYIDDVGRGKSNVNRSRTIGGRGTLRMVAGGWTIDAGGAAQNIDNRDSQYAERGLLSLTRASYLAQPFDNDYALGSLSAAKNWDKISIVSATGVVDHDNSTNYDATGFPGTAGPQLFTDDNRIRLISHETRLTGQTGRGAHWLVGVSGIYATDAIRRLLGPKDTQTAIAGVRNRNAEFAGFGQYALPIGHGLNTTVGGRITYSAASGEPLDTARAEEFEGTRHSVRVLPSLAVSWSARPGLLLFANYEEGSRAGGLAVQAPSAVQRFKTDSVGAAEAGLRLGNSGDSVSGSIIGSHTRWKSIQADLVDANGLPITANIGDGRIWALESAIELRPSTVLTLSGSLFLTDSELTSPDAAYTASGMSELPNVAEAGGKLGFAYAADLSARAHLSLDGNIRYIGRSVLGVAPPLDARQGGYVDTALGARLAIDRIGLSLDVTNLADSHANRFAFGNPFTIAARNQITPLVPRTIRLGLDARF